MVVSWIGPTMACCTTTCWRLRQSQRARSTRRWPGRCKPAARSGPAGGGKCGRRPAPLGLEDRGRTPRARALPEVAQLGSAPAEPGDDVGDAFAPVQGQQGTGPIYPGADAAATPHLGRSPLRRRPPVHCQVVSTLFSTGDGSRKPRFFRRPGLVIQWDTLFVVILGRVSRAGLPIAAEQKPTIFRGKPFSRTTVIEKS